MATVIVLFNLKAGVDRAEYLEWATSADLPTVRSLASVDSFRVLASTGLLGGGTAPYEYVEILEVADMDGLMSEVGSPQMQAIASAFQGFADAPTFIVTESIEAH